MSRQADRVATPTTALQGASHGTSTAGVSPLLLKRRNYLYSLNMLPKILSPHPCNFLFYNGLHLGILWHRLSGMPRGLWFFIFFSQNFRGLMLRGFLKNFSLKAWRSDTFILTINRVGWVVNGITSFSINKEHSPFIWNLYCRSALFWHKSYTLCGDGGATCCWI